MIDYTKILSTSRLRLSTRTDRTITTESESDRGRVLFCPAFRRLQQKAQVFSMEPNAAVRSRLTHSFEVSQIGRYLSDEIGQRLVTQQSLEAGQLSAMVNFVETACLMHDIGNPPFGHFGEAAIQEWFKANGPGCAAGAFPLPAPEMSALSPKIDEALSDFTQFDGNPQGLRIVTKLQWNTDEFGLNLTKTSLATYLKYIRAPLESRSGNFRRKPGYFSTESDVVKQVWDHFEYTEPKRFPLAYVMEAADDIAYCISDLEDSFEKEILNPELALPAIEKVYVAKGFVSSDPCHSEILEAIQAVREGKKDGKEFTYTDFRTTLNTTIIKYAADHFVTEQLAISNGSLKTLLPENKPPGYVLRVLKDYCREHVYTHESVQLIELAGYNAITGLLDQFKPLISITRERFNAALKNSDVDGTGKKILIEPKLLKLFPPKYLKAYHHQVAQEPANDNGLFEWNARAHLITDFVSGMTDDFAMTTYRTLAGMRL